MPLSRHRLQNYSNDGTTTTTNGLVRCEAVLHGCGTSQVGEGGRWAINSVAEVNPVDKPATKSGLRNGGEEGRDKEMRHN